MRNKLVKNWNFLTYNLQKSTEFYKWKIKHVLSAIFKWNHLTFSHSRSWQRNKQRIFSLVIIFCLLNLMFGAHSEFYFFFIEESKIVFWTIGETMRSFRLDKEKRRILETIDAIVLVTHTFHFQTHLFLVVFIFWHRDFHAFCLTEMSLGKPKIIYFYT